MTDRKTKSSQEKAESSSHYCTNPISTTRLCNIKLLHYPTKHAKPRTTGCSFKSRTLLERVTLCNINTIVTPVTLNDGIWQTACLVAEAKFYHSVPMDMSVQQWKVTMRIQMLKRGRGHATGETLMLEVDDN